MGKTDHGFVEVVFSLYSCNHSSKTSTACSL